MPILKSLKNKTFKVISFFTIIIMIEIILAVYLGFTFSQQLQESRLVVKPGVYINNTLLEDKTPEEVIFVLTDLKENKYLQPRNALISEEQGLVIPERRGKTLDIASTLEAVMQAPPQSIIEPKEIKLDPELTLLEIERLNNLWGDYITFFGGGDRGVNIKIASASINNYLLPPGHVFSFNKAVGPVTNERGYTLAPIIIGDDVVPGRGGGICQVSSTLFNAVLDANLEVVERYPHSMSVDYVPPGRDATVAEHLDFKFRNNTDSYVTINANTYGTQCHIQIWGVDSNNHAQ